MGKALRRSGTMELVKLLFLISSFWATVALANSARPYENVDEPIDLFWAARGKKSWPYWQKILNSDGNQKRDETPFWAARGKKYSEHDAPFWAARGKKRWECAVGYVSGTVLGC